MGFKKRHLNWFKRVDELTVVFNIQKSQWSTQAWYYNYGVAINDLHEGQVVSIIDCDISMRFVPTSSKEDIANHVGELIAHLGKWIGSYGTMHSLLIEAQNQRLPL